MNTNVQLNLNYTRFHSQCFHALGYDFSINLVMALTYLNRVYVSVFKDTLTTYDKIANPIDCWIKPQTWCL